MLRLYFIRHGKTFGNTLGRYIGTTDEPLSKEGQEMLRNGSYPRVSAVYCSPLRRCLETAGLIYPDLSPRVEPLLRECDFGEFENRNYQELSGNSAYQAWVDSNGQLPFPGGESREAFRKRCEKGFRRVLAEVVRSRQTLRQRESKGEESKDVSVALIVHGGTIMSILEAFGNPKREFYHWQVGNGEGFGALLEEEAYEKRDEVRVYEIHPISPFAGLSV